MKKFYLLFFILLSALYSNSQTLLSEGFEGGADFPPPGWTLKNGNAPDGYNWTYNSDPSLFYVALFGEPYPAQSGSGSMVYEFDPENNAKAWAITPSLTLTAGVSYTISFYYAVFSEDYPERMKVTVGKTPTIGGQDSVLWNNNGEGSLTNEEWALGTMTYKPASSGKFYFGFNCYSPANRFALMVDDIKIEVTPAATPACTNNISPASNATNVTREPLTLKWNTSAGATSYDLYIGTANPPPYFANTAGDSINLSGGDYSTIYYWNVVPRNGLGTPDSCNSSITSFTTAPPPPPPACVTLKTPGKGEENVEPGFGTFSWSSAPDATGYAFYFGTTNPPDSLGVTPDTTAEFTYLDFNTTYYWSVVPENDGGSSSRCSVYSFTTRASAPAPQNDEACNAITLTLNGPSDCQNTEGATSMASDTISCSAENNTVWYKYRPITNGPVLIKMKRRAGSALDLNAWIGVFTASGSCPALSFKQQFACSGADLMTQDSVSIITGSLKADTTYYIMVDGNSGAYGEFCISLAAPPPLPPNDSCASATPVTAYAPVKSYTLGATQSMAAERCGTVTIGNANDDVWFTFTASQAGNATITLTPEGDFDAVMMAYSGTCKALINIGCADNGIDGEPETLALTGLTAGATYYFRVYGWGSSGSEGFFTLNVSGTSLPVILTDFKGKQTGSVNILSWTTQTEQNNKGFELQRSVDGKNFSKLIFIASKATNGNTASPLNYEFADEKPFAGNTYYRLLQTDKDGKSILSNVVLLKGPKIKTFVLSRVYPNPAKTELKMVLSAPFSDKVNLVITDIAGKVVIRKAAQLIAGDNNLSLNVSKLTPGSYIIKAVCAGGCETAASKFLKQ